MPSRHRPKAPPAPSAPAPQPTSGRTGRAGSDVQHDLERFAAALKDSQRAERTAREHQQQSKAAAARAADDAAARERALATARRDLERAVDAVRRAKQLGKGRAAADEAWKVAKALVIELETGTPPSWAPKPAPVEEADVPVGSAGEPDEQSPTD